MLKHASCRYNSTSTCKVRGELTKAIKVLFCQRISNVRDSLQNVYCFIAQFTASFYDFSFCLFELERRALGLYFRDHSNKSKASGDVCVTKLIRHF